MTKKYIVVEDNRGCHKAFAYGTRERVPLSVLPAGWKGQLVQKNMMESDGGNGKYEVHDPETPGGNINWPNGWGP